MPEKTEDKFCPKCTFSEHCVSNLAFVPAVSAQAETKFHEQFLESNQITVNDFNTKMTKYEKVGNQIHYASTFKFDVEKDINNKIKTLKSSGTFTGIISPDSSIHVEYTGDNFALVTDTSKIGEDQENVLYQYEQVMTVNGETSTQKETFKVPQEQINALKEQSIDSAEYAHPNSLLASKVKVDLPSLAPYGSVLIYNDMQYETILDSLSILIAIAAYFKVPQATAAAAVALAVGTAIPNYLDIDPRDIYLAFFLTTNVSSPMWVEVDYYYK